MSGETGLEAQARPLEPQAAIQAAAPNGGRITVEVADTKVVKSATAVLTTHALGSCIGITIYDPEAKVGGMLHYMLPDSGMSPAKAQTNPCMFGDTGIPKLFLDAYKLGAIKERVILKIAGGGNVLDNGQFFDIGKKNYLVARKILYRNGILIRGELVGGTSGKTMRLYMDTGRVTVRMPNGEEQEI